MFENQATFINPVQYFSLSVNCLYINDNGKMGNSIDYELPSSSDLIGEESFTKIYCGWNEKGLSLNVAVSSPYSEAFYPDFRLGDSVELFFDTRDLKTAGFNTRFCHHFFFLPKSVEGVSKGEVTHFRTEDRHTLCDPELLNCAVSHTKKGYQMDIFIPSQALHGYDPAQCNHLGFTYRINRHEQSSQHFSVVSDNYQIEQQPSLWASLKLVH